jgi:crotonobetainyl-CoA:carnitine CoA-transferase CaiB-like acyl-CoA transferase
MIQRATGRAPLSGIRVLDLGRYQAAPRCAAVLGRLGADVIKIEPPGGEESRAMGPFVRGASVYWAQHNAGKRSIGLDLRSDEGRGLLERLVEISDVLVENFRPGAIEAMGFNYARLRELNPRIIVLHVSGFGRTGQMRERIAFDQVGQAISGFMSLNGDPGGMPTISPFAFVDRITAMHGAIATLAALHERHASGEGQEIDVTLADAAYSSVEVPLASYLSTGEVPERTGNATSLGNMYETSDGRVYVADYGGDRIFTRLAGAIGRPDWIGDARFAERPARSEHSGIIEAALIDWCGGKPAAEVALAFNSVGVPCAVVNDIPAAAREPYFLQSQPSGDVDDGNGGRVRVPGPYMRFGRSGIPEPGPVPRPGQNTDSVLRDVLRMSAGEIEDLRARGVVGG